MASSVGRSRAADLSAAAHTQDSYWLKRQLGQGHFAVVYLADHIPTSQPAAIKILNDLAVKDTGNYLSELRLYQQLDHINLVKMHGWWYAKDFPRIYGYYDCFDRELEKQFDPAKERFCFVFEYCEGGTLEEEIKRRRGPVTPSSTSSSPSSSSSSSSSSSRFAMSRAANPFPLALVLDLGLQLCNAVRHLHGVGVVHSDVKPANILFASAARRVDLKLGDFGVARFHNSGAASSSAVVRGLSKHLPPWYDPYVGVTFPKSGDAWAVSRVLLDMMTLDCEPDPPGHGPDVKAIRACIASQYSDEVAHVVMPLLYVGRHSTQQPAVDVIARSLKDLLRKLLPPPGAPLTTDTTNANGTSNNDDGTNSNGIMIATTPLTTLSSSPHFHGERKLSDTMMSLPFMDALTSPSLPSHHRLPPLSSSLGSESYVPNLSLTMPSSSSVVSPLSHLPSTPLPLPRTSSSANLMDTSPYALSSSQLLSSRSVASTPTAATAAAAASSANNGTMSTDIRRWTARDLRRALQLFFHDNFPTDVLPSTKVDALLVKFSMMTGAVLASETFADLARLIYDVLHDEDHAFMLCKSLSSWIYQYMPSTPGGQQPSNNNMGMGIAMSSSIDIPATSRQSSVPGSNTTQPVAITSAVSSFVFMMTVRVPASLYGEDQIIMDETCNERVDPSRFHLHQTRTEWMITFAAASAAPGDESASLAITARHAPGLVQWLNSTFEPVDAIHFEPPVTATSAGPCITVSSSEPTMTQVMAAFHHRRLQSIWGYQIVRVRKADYLHVSLRVRDSRDIYHMLLARLRSTAPPVVTASGCLLRSIEVPGGGLTFITQASHTTPAPTIAAATVVPPVVPRTSSSSTTISPSLASSVPSTVPVPLYNSSSSSPSSSSSLILSSQLDPSSSLLSQSSTFASSSSLSRDTLAIASQFVPQSSSSSSSSSSSIISSSTSSLLYPPVAITTSLEPLLLHAPVTPNSLSMILNYDSKSSAAPLSPSLSLLPVPSSSPSSFGHVHHHPHGHHARRRSSRLPTAPVTPRIGLDLQVCVRGMHCRNLRDAIHIAAFLHFPAPSDLTHLTDPQSVIPSSPSQQSPLGSSLASSVVLQDPSAPLSPIIGDHVFYAPSPSLDVPSYAHQSASSPSYPDASDASPSSYDIPVYDASSPNDMPIYPRVPSLLSLPPSSSLGIPSYPSAPSNNDIPVYSSDDITMSSYTSHDNIPAYDIPTYAPDMAIPTYPMDASSLPTDATPSDLPAYDPSAPLHPIPHYLPDNNDMDATIPTIADLVQYEESSSSQSPDNGAMHHHHHMPTQVKCTRSTSPHCWCTLCQLSMMLHPLFPMDIAAPLTELVFDYMGPVDITAKKSYMSNPIVNWFNAPDQPVVCNISGVTGILKGRIERNDDQLSVLVGVASHASSLPRFKSHALQLEHKDTTAASASSDASCTSIINTNYGWKRSGMSVHSFFINELTPVKLPLNAPWYSSCVRIYQSHHTRWFLDTILSSPVPGMEAPRASPVVDSHGVVHEGQVAWLSGPVTYIEVMDTIRQAGYACFVVGGVPRALAQGIRYAQPSATGGDTRPPFVDLDIGFGCSWLQLQQLVTSKGWRLGRASPTGSLTRLLFGSRSIASRTGSMVMEGRPMGVWNHDQLPDRRQPQTIGADLVAENMYGDFTCNRIWYCPFNDVLMDPTMTGVEDAIARVLRIPVTRALWDVWADGNPLKAMRYWKFVARGYHAADDDTSDHIRRLAIDQLYHSSSSIAQMLWYTPLADCVAMRVAAVEHIGKAMWDLDCERPWQQIVALKQSGEVTDDDDYDAY